MTEATEALPISSMNKDQLAIYALAEFAVELDKKNKLADLRVQTQALEDKRKADPEAAVAGDVGPVLAKSSHLKNTKTGLVFEATDLLRAYGVDLVPCDKDGNPA